MFQLELPSPAVIATEIGQANSLTQLLLSWVTSEQFVSVCAVWIILFILSILSGWTHTRDAGGSIRRLTSVSIYLAIIGAGPAIVVAICSLLGRATTDQFVFAVFSTLFSLIFMTSSLQPPVRLQGTREKLPLVTDQSFLERVARMSERMGLSIPIVRLWPSVSAGQQALAFAGTIQAPQLVVTDGILNRLDSDESDAIVAHELAHIANGSLFVFPAVFPVSATIGTAVAGWTPMSISIAFAFAFFVGLRRIVNRPIEFNCDLRAARAIGFRVTASALSKIHAAHFIANAGLLPRLIYATSTHPSRDARVAALYDKAPVDDRPDVVIHWNLVRMDGRLATIAAGIWGIVLSASLFATPGSPLSRWMSIPLWGVGILPTVVLSLALRRNAMILQRRMGERWKLLRFTLKTLFCLLGVMLFLGVSTTVILQTFGPKDPNADLDWMVLFITIVNVVLIAVPLSLWYRKAYIREKLEHGVLVALQVHDFPRVLELCAASPRIVQRSHRLRYNRAIAKAVLKDRQAAIADLDGLLKDKPGFFMTYFTLGELCLDSGFPERTIELMKQVGRKLPKDPGVPLLESRALRRLGRIAEASPACEQAIVLGGISGSVLAVAAGLELDRGEIENARNLISAAFEVSPGDPLAMIVRAEIDVKTMPPEEARASVNLAASAVQKDPLIFFDAEIARLQSMLSADVAGRDPFPGASVDELPPS